MNLAKYFETREAKKPNPVWIYGDRISARVGRVLVIGTVIREQYEDAKQVLVHLELPIKLGSEYRSVLYIPSHSIKRLKDYS
jgi:hypothetical protein